MQLQSQFLNFHRPTWPYAGLWNVLVTNLSDHMLVPMHLPGIAVQDLFCYIPVYWGVLWFWKPAITSWHTTIAIEIKFCKRKCQKSKVGVSFWSHNKSRRECCSEMSCLRSEDILSITSSFTSKLMSLDVCHIHLLLPHQTAWRYMWK
jgi:hypothetical protein